MAVLKYVDYLCENSEASATFYQRYLQTRELGRSAAGDVSITDGFLNLTYFKRRPALCEPRMHLGLNQINAQVESVEETKNKYLKLFPRRPFVPESGDIHHGVVRIHDPDGNPVSLLESPFGVNDERKMPGIRQIAYNIRSQT